MPKITITFKDTKTGVDVSVDPTAFKRVKREGYEPSRAEELAIRVFCLMKQAELAASLADEVVPVRGKACCGDCEA